MTGHAIFTVRGRVQEGINVDSDTPPFQWTRPGAIRVTMMGVRTMSPWLVVTNVPDRRSNVPTIINVPPQVTNVPDRRSNVPTITNVPPFIGDESYWGGELRRAPSIPRTETVQQ